MVKTENLLVIESATRFPSIGLIGKEKIIWYSGKEGNHSIFFFEFFEKVKNKKIDKIIITIGPGRFTSLRVGLSFAFGVGFPNNIPIVPLNTFEVLEYFLEREGKKNFGIFLKKGGEGFLLKIYGEKKLKIVKDIPDVLELFTFEPNRFKFNFKIKVLTPILLYRFYQEKVKSSFKFIKYEDIRPIYGFLPYERSLIEKGIIKGLK